MSYTKLLRFAMTAAMVMLFPALLLANDFFVSGTVTNGSTGMPVPNHPVTIQIDSSFNYPGGYYNVVYTSNTGQFVDTVPNAANIGPNLIIMVSSVDICTGQGITYALPNNQGTTNSGVANFTFCQNTPGGCSANFSFIVNNNGTVDFTNLSTGQGTLMFNWSFGNGTTSTSANPTASYNANGVYLVCLAVMDTWGGAVQCVDSFCTTIIIGPGGSGNCQANFTFTVNPTGVVDFQNLSTGQGQLSYYWDLGNNQSSTLTNPSQFYQPGVYNVCLFLVDLNGCRDSICVTIAINPGGGNCAASFTYQVNNQTLYLYDNSTGAYNFQTWSISNGLTTTQPNPVIGFNAPGVYTVCLTIEDTTNPAGCYDVYCDSIVVPQGSGGNCSAAFSYVPGNQPNEIVFYNQSSPMNVNVLWFVWDLGDGTMDTTYGPGPVHQYAAPDSYYVCLTIYASTPTGGICSDTYCGWIAVGGVNWRFSISGTVYESNSSTASQAMVYLIGLDSLQLEALDSTYTNQGQYVFHNVLPGVYRVKAALSPNTPLYHQRLPTYHTSNLFWFDADLVNVTIQNVVGVDVYLQAGNNPGGPGFVGGSVTQGANKMDGEGDPIAGALVMLLNPDSSGVQYAHTDAQGTFSFSNVAYGNYLVWAEFPGKETTPVWVNVAPGNENIAGINIIVETEKVFSSASAIAQPKASGWNAAVYPNPVTDVLAVALEAAQSDKAVLRIYSPDGKQILQKEQQINTGKQAFFVPVDELSQGMYFLQITGEKEILTIRFLKK